MAKAKTSTKKKRGTRKPEFKEVVAITVKMERSLAAKIDRFAVKNDLRSRSFAIRKMIEDEIGA